MIVKSILAAQGIAFGQVELGRAEIFSPLRVEQKRELDDALRQYELELMEHPKKILVERIKTTIIEIFQSANGDKLYKFSEQLSQTLHYDYTYLANTFAEQEKSTIEKFYIIKKIERVKELMMYEGMEIKEIAYLLSYSSVSHLCKQFKKVVGHTPAKFKKLWESEKCVV